MLAAAALFCCFWVAGCKPASAQQSQAQIPPPNQSAPPPSEAAPSAEQGPERLHIIVGHSLLIRTPVRVKRLLTGNPAVIDAVPTSPSEVVVTAKAVGGSSLILWQENGQSQMIDVAADVDATPLRNALEETYPSSEVNVQTQEGKVVLVGTVPSTAVLEQMLKMAGNYSKDVVNGLQVAQPPRLKQVILKVRFAEADRSKLSAFAINIFSTGATNTIGTISTQQFGPLASQSASSSGNGGTQSLTNFSLSDLLNIFLFRPDINLGATIKALQQKNVLQILAEPNLMAISGQPAHFLAGGEFPYPVVQGGTAGTVPAITIQFRPYGVKLEFTAVIQDNGAIRMKIAPEVSSLDYSNTVTISGFVMPSISTRRAETEVELKNGQSFGIAGLLDERTTVLMSKIPGIGDIPILGELFKSRSVNRANSELIVLVTPIIVDPVGGEELPAQGQVEMPVRNLTNQEFDKNLPYPSNPSEKK